VKGETSPDAEPPGNVKTGEMRNLRKAMRTGITIEDGILPKQRKTARGGGILDKNRSVWQPLLEKSSSFLNLRKLLLISLPDFAIGQTMLFRREFIDNPHRVLVVQLGGIRETLSTIPMLCALQDLLPDCRVALAAKPNCCSLLAGHSTLEKVIPVPPSFSWSLVTAQRIQLHCKKFAPEIAIDTQGLRTTAVLGKLSGAPHRVGPIAAGTQFGASFLYNEKVRLEEQNEILQKLELLQPFDLPGLRNWAGDIRFEFPEAEEERGTITAFREKIGLQGKFAILYLSDDEKNNIHSELWPEKNYDQLARHLAMEYGLKVLVVRSGGPRGHVGKELDAVRLGYAIAAPQMSLRILAALAKRSHLFVASDSIPLHLSANLGVPTIGFIKNSQLRSRELLAPESITFAMPDTAAGPERLHRGKASSHEAVSVQDVLIMIAHLLLEQPLPAARFCSPRHVARAA